MTITIPTPGVALTPQQFFDNALFGIRSQGYKHSSYRGSCLYRADHTAECPVRCAAGHSIPDSLYSDSYEGLPIDRLMNESAAIAMLLGSDAQQRDVSVAMLKDVQFAHDQMLATCYVTPFDSTKEDAWENKMNQIANQYGLVYKPVATEGAAA